MKKPTISLTAAFFVFCFTAAFLYAQTGDQEKCARWSTEFFYREFKSSEGSLGGIPASFARIYCSSSDPCNFHAHYNKKLNKCFILVEIQGIAGKPLPNGAVPVHLQYFLYDAYERIPYGVYEAKYDGTGNKTTTNCWVKDKFRVTPFGKLPECKYEHEFLDAINSFMKE
jgi:hypothetical protein